MKPQKPKKKRGQEQRRTRPTETRLRQRKMGVEVCDKKSEKEAGEGVRKSDDATRGRATRWGGQRARRLEEREDRCSEKPEKA